MRWLRHAIVLALTVLVTIVLVFAVQARMRLADLRAWHRIELDEEYQVSSAQRPASFDEYRLLEDRLFAELRERVLLDDAAADTQPLGRYSPNSFVARLALETLYNHSYEFVPRQTEPRGAVLLVHGLSDSPYSMRSLAETFLEQGYYVVVLRLPGHGTVPAGLLNVSWQDWYGAVVLAAQHAAAKAPGKPLLVGGHSTGAALVTLYALRALEDSALPRPQRLYLVSAAIGLSKFAVMTNVISSLSFIPWFEKSRWLDVYPEYDPYKYNSFPVNAANQIYRLTRVVQSTIDTAEERGQLHEMPQVIIFQSIVDSTVTAAGVVRGLLARLPANGHELVVFDVNRYEMLEGLIASGPIQDLERIRSAVDLPFKVTLIANRGTDTRAMAAYTRAAGTGDVVRTDLPFEWPAGVFSLGHVALPFPPDDAVYGIAPTQPGAQPRFNLGALAARGEAGALVMPLGTFGRLRSNPFFDVIRAKVVESLAD
jgi:alpha-beta hydrolase superfamily lysophospholipase